MEGRIQIFDAATLEPTRTISSIYHGPHAHNVCPVALGDRWLAYPTHEPLAAEETQGGLATTRTPALHTVMGLVEQGGSTLMQGVASVSGMITGKKPIASGAASEPARSGPVDDIALAGLVKIEDLYAGGATGERGRRKRVVMLALVPVWPHPRVSFPLGAGACGSY